MFFSSKKITIIRSSRHHLGFDSDSISLLFVFFLHVRIIQQQQHGSLFLSYSSSPGSSCVFQLGVEEKHFLLFFPFFFLFFTFHNNNNLFPSRSWFFFSSVFFSSSSSDNGERGFGGAKSVFEKKGDWEGGNVSVLSLFFPSSFLFLRSFRLLPLSQKKKKN